MKWMKYFPQFVFVAAICIGPPIVWKYQTIAHRQQLRHKAELRRSQLLSALVIGVKYVVEVRGEVAPTIGVLIFKREDGKLVFRYADDTERQVKYFIVSNPANVLAPIEESK